MENHKTRIPKIMKIFLDDNRTPYDNTWVTIRCYHDFIHIIQTSFDRINVISFDHDLGSDEFTGFDCAKFLIDYCMTNNKELPQCYSHSANPIGRENIINLINNYLTFNDKEPTCKWSNINNFI